MQDGIAMLNRTSDYPASGSGLKIWQNVDTNYRTRRK